MKGRDDVIGLFLRYRPGFSVDAKSGSGDWKHHREGATAPRLTFGAMASIGAVAASVGQISDSAAQTPADEFAKGLGVRHGQSTSQFSFRKSIISSRALIVGSPSLSMRWTVTTLCGVGTCEAKKGGTSVLAA